MKKNKILSALLLSGVVLPLAACGNPGSTIEMKINSPIALLVNQQETVTATYTPAQEAEMAYTITSSDETVISVLENNVIKANKLGQSLITATSENTAILPAVLNVEVIDIICDIPTQISIVDVLEVSAQATSSNPLLNDFTFSVKDAEILAFDATDNTLNPMALGETEVYVGIKNTNIKKAYPIKVVQGYDAPTSFDSALELLDSTFSKVSLQNASDITVHATESGEAIVDTYRLAENGYSKDRKATYYDKVDQFETDLVVTKDNKLESYHIDKTDAEDSTIEIKAIVDTVEDSYTQISKADVKNAILPSVFMTAQDETFGEYVKKEAATKNVKVVGSDDLYTVTVNAEYVANEVRFTKELAYTVNKTGELQTVNLFAYKVDEGFNGDGTGYIEQNISMNFLYNKKYAESELHIKDTTDLYATSFKVSYDYNSNKAEVGNYFSAYKLAISNVTPATAINVYDYEVTFEDPNGVMNLSGYTPKFAKAGKVTVVVTPKANKGDVCAKVELTITQPNPSYFGTVKLDCDNNTLKVGSSANIIATLEPSGASQEVTVVSAEPTSVEVKLVDGKWVAKAIAMPAEGTTVKLTVTSKVLSYLTSDITVTVESANKPVEDPAYVGTFKGGYGTHGVPFTMVINNDGTGYATNNSAKTIFKFTYKVLSSGNIFATVTDLTLSSYKAGNYSWPFDPATNTLSAFLNTSGDIVRQEQFTCVKQ